MSSEKRIPIAELKEKLSALPKRQRDADSADRFKRYIAKMAKNHEAASAVQASVIIVSDEFDEFDAKPVKEKLSRICAAAKSLRKRLADDENAGASPETEKAVLTISEGVEQLEHVAMKSWTEVLQRHTAGPAALVPVLTKLMPTDGAKLGEAVRRATSAAGQLPVNRQAVKTARTGFNDAEAVLGRLKLDKNIAEFLQQIAGQEGATIAALARPEISEFIKQHRLTTALRVRLG